MSIWIYSKDKKGRKSVTSISVPFFLITFFILYVGSIITILFQGGIEPIFIIFSYLVGIGFILLIISKVFQFRKGIWNSWGMKEMPIIGKTFYITGYFLMVFGIANLLLNL